MSESSVQSLQGSSVEKNLKKIANELSLRPAQVRSTAPLLAEGGTVPFIARYRKEATGSLDEVAITTIRDRLAQLAELDQRRAAIVKSLEERNLLTDDLLAQSGRGRDDGGAGRRLPAVPAQAPHPGHDRPGEGAGAAGGAAVQAGRRPPTRSRRPPGSSRRRGRRWPTS